MLSHQESRNSAVGERLDDRGFIVPDPGTVRAGRLTDQPVAGESHFSLVKLVEHFSRTL